MESAAIYITSFGSSACQLATVLPAAIFLSQK